MVDLFLAALGLLVIGLAAAALSVATTVLTTRAPGMRMRRVPFFSWSALVASLGLLLVLPVLLGVLIYLFVDHRYARAAVRRQRRHRRRGSASPSPSRRPTCSPLPAVGLARRADPGHVPQADADARRRVRRLGLVGVGGARRRHPAGRSTPAVVRQRRRPRRLRRQGADLVPYVLFTLLPLLGVVIVLLVGPRRPAAERLETGPAERHAGVPVRLLRRRDDPRRHGRRRARADRRPRPAGHGVRGGRRSSTSSTAASSAALGGVA